MEHSVYHIPALLAESIQGLAIKPNGTYVDVTFGGGGHSRAILEHLGPCGRLMGMDQDMDAYANNSRHLHPPGQKNRCPNPTSWTWTFDGTDVTTSHEQNPTVTYLVEGTYGLKLEVANEMGSSVDEYTSNAIQAGGEQEIWNIAPEENADLMMMEMGWYGNYAGTNWLGMGPQPVMACSCSTPLSVWHKIPPTCVGV